MSARMRLSGKLPQFAVRSVTCCPYTPQYLHTKCLKLPFSGVICIGVSFAAGTCLWLEIWFESPVSAWSSDLTPTASGTTSCSRMSSAS